jgi:hypothetical protein
MVETKSQSIIIRTMEYFGSMAFRRQAVAILEEAKERNPECVSIKEGGKNILFIRRTVVYKILTGGLDDYRSRKFPRRSPRLAEKIKKLSDECSRSGRTTSASCHIPLAVIQELFEYQFRIIKNRLREEVLEKQQLVFSLSLAIINSASTPSINEGLT